MKRPLNEGGPSHDDEYDSDLPATLLFDEARLAVAGFLPAAPPPPARATPLTCGSSLPGATRWCSESSTSSAATSSFGGGPWRRGA